MAKTCFKILFFVSVLVFPFLAKADNVDFNVNSSYDYQGRSQVSAFLHLVSEKAYFFAEENFYNSLTPEKMQEFSEAVKDLSEEFDDTIYPELTRIYGTEWKPGIDGDDRIAILLSRIKSNSGGYFYSGDEYSKARVFDSNEREMIYFNADYVTDPLAKSYLAHELMHLISFNQKEMAYGVEEDVWLNEGRAELAPTLIGYDDVYEGSSLQNRVRTFLQNPNDSLGEWRGIAADYGVLNIFMQYILDHYGQKVLVDSLHSSKTGIASLNEALMRNGYEENFSDVFNNWLIAVLINDCSIGPKYCYTKEGLDSLKILPQLNYLPVSGESRLSITNYSKDWMGSWIKLIGGKGNLKVEFSGDESVTFSVPYVLKDINGDYSVGYFDLDSSQGEINIGGFGDDYVSLVIIPSVQSKERNFGTVENYYNFSWTASINDNSEVNEELIAQLEAQVEYLLGEVARLQAQIAEILAQRGDCQITQNLYYGMVNNNEVKCLQQFLKSQPEIYPQGYVTGNFSSLTLQAVIRFQEKYSSEILAPFGLLQGSGFVGAKTKSKINSLMNN